MKKMIFIWIGLIILLVILFPKSCRIIPESQTIDYKCLGIETNFSTKIPGTNLSSNMCAGLCLEKSKQVSVSNNNQQIQIPIIAGIGSSLKKTIPLLIALFIAIFAIKIIMDIRKKSKSVIKIVKPSS